jgi:glutamate/tyrosine decarboxylase-like PLP-dependent enzyme
VSKSLKAIDLYNMIGICPDSVLLENRHFCMRNLADASDTELISMQNNLISKLSKEILKADGILKDGLILHSGSEANEVALSISKVTCSASRKSLVIMSTLTHSSVENACSKIGLDVLKLPVETETMRVSKRTLLEAINKNLDVLASVVLTHGVTTLGTRYDMDLDLEVDALLLDNNIRTHVDAAYGGIIYSLASKSPEHWKSIKSMATLTIDTHKFVGTVGCGLLLLKERQDKNYIGQGANYFNGNNSSLGTTRSAYPLATALGTINYFGIEGLTTMAKGCINNATRAGIVLQNSGYKLITNITSGVVAVSLANEKEVDDYVANFLEKGFKVSPIKVSNQSNCIYGFRIVVTNKPEASSENINLFIESARSLQGIVLQSVYK